MLSEVLKEQHSDAETTERKSPKKKINLLLVACYQAEAVISMDACPLELWLKHERTNESLAHLACKYLVMLATTVQCESLFSLSGDIVNKKRGALSSANVNKVICLSDWLIKK
ncbi:hypothetical protein UY3_04234 [Chelonia mydas]|uniref:HAT C-terminal dimerisation domain-containing protein n=1 Tax=Chelonia mydas TaxID=8469 RepID=M7BMU2_CHEMY|nr:hypothetical protein UY3_04234 [Chelonia mydas]